MPGVVVVHDGDFVGVTAPSSSAGRPCALAAIKAGWKPGPPHFRQGSFDDLKRQGRAGAWRLAKGAGSSQPADRKAGRGSADIHLEQTYTIAYIAHAAARAPSRPWPSGIDGKLTVWTGSQRPFGVRDDLAACIRSLPPMACASSCPTPGAGYGGKHTGEAAVEAARLPAAAGKPVKLVWTREEEFTWAYFRPAGVIEVKSSARRGRRAHRLGIP